MNPKKLATIGLIIGIFLEALEGTVVATAMPTVVNELGGRHLYALPFSIYLLTQTVTSPLWGRISDLVERKRLYLAGIIIYLLGSGLCGMAHNMPCLVGMRVIQGIGAGCLATLTFTLIGDMYVLEKRAKVQGYISAVWGIAGLLGPLAGGLIVDNISWRWVFYLNLPFGLIAFALCAIFLSEVREGRQKFQLDLIGTAFLVAGMGLLVWGLDQKVLWMIIAGVACVVTAMPFEFKHPAPLLPIKSLRNLFVRSSVLNNLLAGAAYFGVIAYIPLFVQGAFKSGATTAGVVLTPMVVGWTIASIVGGRILHRVGLEWINTAGFLFLSAGIGGLAFFVHKGLYVIAATGFVAGFGMGFGMLTTLLLVQDNSPKSELGAVTAAAMYARSIGGAIGVSLISLFIIQTQNIGHQQFLGEFQHGFLLSFALAATALIVSAVAIRPANKRPVIED